MARSFRGAMDKLLSQTTNHVDVTEHNSEHTEVGMKIGMDKKNNQWNHSGLMEWLVDCLIYSLVSQTIDGVIQSENRQFY